MTNAEMTTPASLNLTRRTMLRSLALTSAAAIVPATAMGANPTTPHPDDVELVVLGEEYRALHSENGKVLRRIDRLRPLWAAEIKRRGLIGPGDVIDQEGFDLLESEIGFAPLQDRNEKLSDRMVSIEVRSAELHASSVEGLQAKLLIAYLCQGSAKSVGPAHEHQNWDVQLFNHVFADLDLMVKARVPAAAVGRPMEPAPLPDLASLIERHEQDWQAFEEACIVADPQDDRYEGATAEARSAYLGDVERESFFALLEHPVRSLADVRAKAAYLSSRHQQDNFDHTRGATEALLSSFLP